MMLRLDELVNYLRDLFASHANVLREEVQTKGSQELDMERAREYVEELYAALCERYPGMTRDEFIEVARLARDQ
jgi:hypothetical protein